MLYEFKCRATGTVTMTESVGRKIVELMGKSPGPKGIITVDQMPAAIKALRSAAERDRKATEAARRGTPAGAAVPAGVPRRAASVALRSRSAADLNALIAAGI